MAADDQSDPDRSGSRREPADGSTPPGSEDPTTPLPPPVDSSPRKERRMIGVPVAAAVAAGLIVASGLGGYAIGAATSDDDLMRVSDGRGGTGGFPQLPDRRDGDGHWLPGIPPGVPPDFNRDGDGGTDDGSGSDSDEGAGAIT